MQIPGGPAQEQAGLATAELVRHLYHNKWRVIGLALATTLIALLIGYAQPAQYQATTSILLEPRENRAVHVQEAYDPGVETGTYLLTQLEIIRSREIAEKVVKRLDLVHEPLLTQAAGNSIVAYWMDKLRKLDWRNWMPFLKTPPPAPTQPSDADLKATEDQLRESVITVVQRQISTDPVPRTQLVHVSFSIGSPRLAATVANAIADAYIEYGLDARLEISKKATHWLTDKLSDIRGNLEKSEQALQTFREQQKIVDVGGAKSLLDEELLDNSHRLREAQKQRNDLAGTYAKVLQAGSDVRRLEEIGDLLHVPLVQNAKGNVLSALEALKQAQQRYGEKHPQYITAMTRVESAERTFRDQLLLAAQNTRNAYEIARDTEKNLGETMESEKDQIRSLDRKAYEQSVLEREVASNKQLYDTFLTSFKETDSSSSYEPITVRILETALAPDTPTDPNMRKFAIEGTLVGLVLGVLLLSVAQLLDETVRSPEEIEALTGLPVMSVVPKASASIGVRKNLPALFIEHPRTPFAEGIRTIRTSLKLNDVDKSYKRILITSTIAGEGKSSLASCLAMAFAPGEKVLLLEADLRAPSLKRMFQIPKERPGLMELLTGEAKLEDCIYRHEQSQLDVLPVAKTPANPAEVVNSAAFAKLVAALSEQYDRVILDSPPSRAASDSLVLARMADVVLFTIKADSTRRRAVAAAIKQLRQMQAHVVGTVLNQVDAYKNPNYADTYYYARHYYG